MPANFAGSVPARQLELQTKAPNLAHTGRHSFWAHRSRRHDSRPFDTAQGSGLSMARHERGLRQRSGRVEWRARPFDTAQGSGLSMARHERGLRQRSGRVEWQTHEPSAQLRARACLWLAMSEAFDSVRTSRMARPAGLEPAAPGLEGRCSIQLSYGRPLRTLM